MRRVWRGLPPIRYVVASHLRQQFSVPIEVFQTGFLSTFIAPTQQVAVLGFAKASAGIRLRVEHGLTRE